MNLEGDAVLALEVDDAWLRCGRLVLSGYGVPVAAGKKPGVDSVGRRLTRLRGLSNVADGLLSVPEAAALASVGFLPISDVFGAVASSVLTGDFLRSGLPGSVSAFDQRTFTSSDPDLRASPPRTVTALRDGYRTALSRLVVEARAVGADGVVAVRVEHDAELSVGQKLWTFRASGTAVRSVGATRAHAPFVTTLPASQVAAAVGGGWLPLSVIVCPVMAIRYSGGKTRRTMTRRAPNAEVDALTDLVNKTRHQARADFAAAAHATHADGAVLTSMTLAFEQAADDPVCQATVLLTGTALACFAAPMARRRAPLTIIPLDKGL